MNAWYIRAQAGSLPTLAVNGCSRDDDPTEHDRPKPPEPLRQGSPPTSAGAPVAAQRVSRPRLLAGPRDLLRRHFGLMVF